MRFRQVAKYALAAALTTLAGCTLFVDVSDIDRECAANEKICSGHCVRKNDPAYGCTSELCASCELTHAVPRCEEGVCKVDYCLFGFDCPSLSGCSANILFDRTNCGVCKGMCDPGDSCRDGQCVGS